MRLFPNFIAKSGALRQISFRNAMLMYLRLSIAISEHNFYTVTLQTSLYKSSPIQIFLPLVSQSSVLQATIDQISQFSLSLSLFLTGWPINITTCPKKKVWSENYSPNDQWPTTSAIRFGFVSKSTCAGLD